MPGFGTPVFDSQLYLPASWLLVLACFAWTLGPQETLCVPSLGRLIVNSWLEVPGFAILLWDS